LIRQSPKTRRAARARNPFVDRANGYAESRSNRLKALARLLPLDNHGSQK
tara:strand:+ start:22213 stop:22362 length:150 start_codon:yes stop_codon:yes gene_type:complete